ncbi:hypothetical protein BW723_10855 [Polaribacter reichenbachii]|uniref:Uncharacterized protein n=1 Tax=Polaribacter reichenbachii TaxID=996801 RepID=A0A1B8TQ22_9FLAO|nr:hypothetical protein [Polaribacter reichenbachii]APZ46751.1 hypothetical protein BW723_10855 [Polaribacter reichenbachii]AUC17394.1 hypothetical protein BTO17_01300 [Polaribacter reichenbachii]OBY61731.1 hypothetical protein LPB301_16900 [Polaribacter reichenbachii]
MHASTHGAIGIAIITATYVITKSEKKTFIIGGILAFASHYVLDFIGESPYKTIQEMLFIEVAVYLWSLILMFFLGKKYLKFSVFAFFMANLMDYIDKKMYLSIFLPKEYPFTYYFHSKNQVIFPISYQNTIIAAIVSVILIGVCFLWLKNSKRRLLH